MADRYQSDDRSRRGRPQRSYGRQAEQFQSDYDDERRSQMGDSWRDDDYGAQQSGWQSDERFEREDSRDDRAPLSDRYGNERFGTSGYGPSRYTPGGGRSFSSFTGNDFGGRDFSAGTGTYGQERNPSGRGYGGSAWGAAGSGAGSWLGANHGEWRDRDFGRSRGRRDERGFFERAGDEVASWFGDEQAMRRREQDHRGRGPAGYTRSDERIREDVNDRLTEDWRVDARGVEVSVASGEVTLEGTVPSREQKRRAEDLIDSLSGVKHVQNNLRVSESGSWDRNNSGETSNS